MDKYFSIQKVSVKKHGESLIEMILTLTVIAVMMIGSPILYMIVKNSESDQREQRNIVSLKDNIVSFYENEPDYENVNILDLYKAGLLNYELNSSGEVQNEFGGIVKIEPSNAGPGTNPNGMFEISYSTVPAESCQKIISNVAPLFYKIEVYDKAGNGGEVKTAFDDDTGKLNVTNLSKYCNGEKNKILFYGY